MALTKTSLCVSLDKELASKLKDLCKTNPGYSPSAIFTEAIEVALKEYGEFLEWRAAKEAGTLIHDEWETLLAPMADSELKETEAESEDQTKKVQPKVKKGK